MPNVLRSCLLLALLLAGCATEPEEPTRAYRMGMQHSAPRFDDHELAVQTLLRWTPRADAAIISTEVPWEELLAGMSPATYANSNYKDLVQYYRANNFELWIYIDPQNGLDRTSDALELQAAGRSIADNDMQQLYRRFVMVMDSLFQPEHVGLALETNLIRDAAPSEIYQGVKQAVNDAANDLQVANSGAKLSISVQVDHAWGKLVGGSYTGVEQDFNDFPFIEELGLSSYPYFGFETPDEIPINYYSKLVEGKSIPVFISEGGWTSQSVTTPERTIVSSPELQEKYLRRHKKLLDEARAIALFQLTFTDIDLDHLSDDVPESIKYFAFLGLVDKELNSKPSLQAWDDLFEHRLKENN
jgi:hypothetical protein